MNNYFSQIFKKIVCAWILLAFLSTSILPPAYAQQALIPRGSVGHSTSGTIVKSIRLISPPVLRGIKVHPENALRFDFIIDMGDLRANDEHLREESTKLIKYFLAALTVPEDDLWVNLSPSEPDRIIPKEFGVTEMGRDMLAADYLLKQLSASMMGSFLPSSDLLSKIWITPDKAVVYENGDKAFVAESRLKVLMEEDMIAEGRMQRGDERKIEDTFDFSLQASFIKNNYLPAIENEINSSSQFAQLRQIYNSLILAAWFKRNLRESILKKYYVGKGKTNGVEITDKDECEKIYQHYLESFKQGVTNLIKEEYDPTTQEIVSKKYITGGGKFRGKDIDQAMIVKKLTQDSTSLFGGMSDMTGSALMASVELVVPQHSQIPTNADGAMTADLTEGLGPKVYWHGTSLYALMGAIQAQRNGAGGYKLLSAKQSEKFNVLLMKPSEIDEYISLDGDFQKDGLVASIYALKFKEQKFYKTKKQFLASIAKSIKTLEKLNAEGRLTGKYFEQIYGMYKRYDQRARKLLEEISDEEFRFYQHMSRIPIVIGVKSSAVTSERSMPILSDVSEIGIKDQIDFAEDVLEIRVGRQYASMVGNFLQAMKLDKKVAVVVNQDLGRDAAMMGQDQTVKKLQVLIDEFEVLKQSKLTSAEIQALHLIDLNGEFYRFFGPGHRLGYLTILENELRTTIDVKYQIYRILAVLLTFDKFSRDEILYYLGKINELIPVNHPWRKILPDPETWLLLPCLAQSNSYVKRVHNMSKVSSKASVIMLGLLGPHMRYQNFVASEEYDELEEDDYFVLDILMAKSLELYRDLRSKDDPEAEKVARAIINHFVYIPDFSFPASIGKKISKTKLRKLKREYLNKINTYSFANDVEGRKALIKEILEKYGKAMPLQGKVSGFLAYWGSNFADGELIDLEFYNAEYQNNPVSLIDLVSGQPSATNYMRVIAERKGNVSADFTSDVRGVQLDANKKLREFVDILFFEVGFEPSWRKLDMIKDATDEAMVVNKENYGGVNFKLNQIPLEVQGNMLNGNVSEVMIEDIQREDFKGFEPRILQLVPVSVKQLPDFFGVSSTMPNSALN